MVNTGKFSKESLETRPVTATANQAEVAVIRNVVAYVHDKWLRFDTMELARQVVPPQEHHKIYTDPLELKHKLGARRLMELGQTFGVKSTEELWAKLQLMAYDPALKYAEMHQAEKMSKGRGPRVKRYKKKVSYRFVFQPENNGHQEMYARLPPQACAIIDILVETIELPQRQQERGDLSNVFTEEELQGLIHLMRDRLYTKQDPWRIFQYYRSRLISGGMLRFYREGK